MQLVGWFRSKREEIRASAANADNEVRAVLANLGKYVYWQDFIQ